MTRKRKYREGDIVETKHGKIKILKYIGSKKLPDGSRTHAQVTVQFIDSGWIYTVQTTVLSKGYVKDRMERTVYDIGYLGTNMDIPNDEGSVQRRAYRMWVRMLQRCYGGLDKYHSYVGCTVDERWQCFKNFYDDLPKLEGYDRWLRGDGMQLDKDIKVKGNKIYSLKTCMFVTAYENRSDAAKGDGEMKLPTLKIKKLDEHAILPKAMTIGSVGLDIAVSKPITFFPHYVTKVHTGLAMEIPKGYHGEIHIRSSWGKKGIRLANCTGIIDSDYRGEIILIVINDTNDVYYAPEEERIAQFILVKDPSFKIEEVNELGRTERGIGGFGSTSKENKGDK